MGTTELFDRVGEFGGTGSDILSFSLKVVEVSSLLEYMSSTND